MSGVFSFEISMPNSGLNSRAISPMSMTTSRMACWARSESCRLLLPQTYCEMSYKNCADDESGGAGKNTKPLGNSVLLKYSSLGVGSCACTVILHTARATATRNRLVLMSFVLILLNLNKNEYLFQRAKVRNISFLSKKNTIEI